MIEFQSVSKKYSDSASMLALNSVFRRTEIFEWSKIRSKIFVYPSFGMAWNVSDGK